jgi:bacterioferritin
MQRMNAVPVDEAVPEQLKLDLKAEQEILKLYTEGVTHCAKAGDDTTRHMLQDMQKDTDDHIDWIETQQALIEQVGFDNYLREQDSQGRLRSFCGNVSASERRENHHVLKLGGMP